MYLTNNPDTGRVFRGLTCKQIHSVAMLTCELGISIELTEPGSWKYA